MQIRKQFCASLAHPSFHATKTQTGQMQVADCDYRPQLRTRLTSYLTARDTFRPADELIHIEAVVLAFDEMRAAADEIKAVRERLKNLTADQGDRLGIGIDSLAKAL